jgi:hypothetical protein
MNHNQFGVNIDHTEIHAAEVSAHSRHQQLHPPSRYESEKKSRGQVVGLLTAMGTIALGSLAVSGGIIASTTVAPIALVTGLTAKIISHCMD